MALSWSLPPSPDSKLYAQILAEIEVEQRHDPLQAMILFRAVAEADYYFFVCYTSSLGSYRIKDPGHPAYGDLWVRQPFMFDRCRDLQRIIEERRNRVWIKWFRHSFKTTLVKEGILWIAARDTTETTFLFTHKVEQSGESMGGDILQEVKQSETLQDHWPQFRGKLPEESDTRITFHRPPGPREPSVSVYPILGSATSGHPTRIFVDDAVTDRIIDSVELTRRVDKNLDRLVPLRGDETPIVFVGTVWGHHDPVYRREQDGYFLEVSEHAAYDAAGNPQLRSKRFFIEQRQMIRDDFLWASQYLLRVIARGDRYFLDDWKTYYTEAIEDVARGSNIHIILDTGGGEEDADFTVLRVLAVRYDERHYTLDLWRERMGLVDTQDILFGLLAEDREKQHNLWKPLKGLVPRWQKFDPDLTVWVEEFGASAWESAMKAEALRRDIDVRIRRLPPKGSGMENRRKSLRIRNSQPWWRARRILLPQGGFGHGSKDDPRDTMEQFFQDEYGLWTFDPKKDEGINIQNDDMLDTFAWPCQEEIARLMPAPNEPGSVYDMSGAWPSSRLDQQGGEPSWRVM